MFVQVKVVEFVVHLQQQLLHFVAGVVELVLVLAADAQIQGVFAFFLVLSFLEARALASQSELDHFVRVHLRIEVSAALLDYSFHVGAFAADDSSCHLKFLFVIDLDVVPACVLDVLLVAVGHLGVIDGGRAVELLELELSWVEGRGRLVHVAGELLIGGPKPSRIEI